MVQQMTMPDPGNLVVKAQAAKIDSPATNMKPDPESSEEVEAASNQSLIPSSLGMTFCVDGDIESIEV